MEDQNKKINFKNMSEGAGGQDFYVSFKEKLEQVERFPGKYSFKFIILNNPAKIEELKAVFTDLPLQLAESKNGKYVSVTISKEVQDADEVIGYYKKASVIEGIMML